MKEKGTGTHTIFHLLHCNRPEALDPKNTGERKVVKQRKRLSSLEMDRFGHVCRHARSLDCRSEIQTAALLLYYKMNDEIDV